MKDFSYSRIGKIVDKSNADKSTPNDYLPPSKFIKKIEIVENLPLKTARVRNLFDSARHSSGIISIETTEYKSSNNKILDKIVKLSTHDR